jgi:hypothetical protein
LRAGEEMEDAMSKDEASLTLIGGPTVLIELDGLARPPRAAGN